MLRTRALVALMGLCLAGLCLARCGWAEDEYPHTAEVGAHGAVVHSGPGKAFYATDELKAGDTVEVWRRETNGWLAIRPPECSFSFVKSEHVKRIPQTDLVEVTADDALAWVGGHVAHKGDHKWQVRLSRGERLVVLGERQVQWHLKEPEGTYFQVEPPAGEFRWVHARDLADSEPERARVEKDWQPTRRDLAIEPTRADAGVQLADYEATVNQPSQREKPSPAGDGFVARKGTANSKPAVVRTATNPSRPATPTNRTSTTSSAAKSTAFEETLRDIQLRLSMMAVRSPNEWDFSGLQAETNRLLERSPSAADRSRAEQVLEEIDEFKTLQERYMQLGETRDASPSTDSGVDPRFDGTGWLLPVHSTQRSAPPYALLDRDGRILQFVSPAPGLNLHRYLRKEIGVYGQRSFIPSLDKPHVAAQRVIELDRHRR